MAFMSTGFKIFFMVIGIATVGAGFYFFSPIFETETSEDSIVAVEQKNEDVVNNPTIPNSVDSEITDVLELNESNPLNNTDSSDSEASSLQNTVQKTELVPVPVKPATPREPQEHIVHIYSFADWRPANLTVYVGDTVTYINEDNLLHWPGADPHPTHSSLPDLDALGGISKGQSYSYTFRKVGVYGHHDHLPENPPTIGLITVLPRE